MKNIHVLPSRKPIGIHFYDYYITSDEEIKEGDWVYYLHNSGLHEPRIMKVIKPNYSDYKPYSIHFKSGFGVQEDCKKIILTTDQDLIKDGVQAIDDEFLEWFVKNPSCEEVEVVDSNNRDLSHNNCNGLRYYTIIPKEETKQETLEEFAEKYKSQFIGLQESRYASEDFINGAKWQSERMYSEEDMKQAFKVGFSIGYGSDVHAIDEKNRTCDEWFEQFKRK